METRKDSNLRPLGEEPNGLRRSPCPNWAVNELGIVDEFDDVHLLPNPILNCLKACTYSPLRSIFFSEQSTAGKRFPGNLNLRRRDPWVRNDLIEGDS